MVLRKIRPIATLDLTTVTVAICGVLLATLNNS